MRLLLVEDDPILGDAVQNALRHAGYATDWLRDGQAADTALRTQTFDLVLLDLGLPRQSGLSVLRSLRSRKVGTPVLIVTAQDGIEDRVAGLDAGADDYLVKPFALAELEARVRALLRRRHGADSNLLTCGVLQYDAASRCAWVGEAALDLSARELAVLEVLLRNQGRLVSKDQMVDHLCAWGEEVSHNAIEVYVHRLRKKLEPHQIPIATVRGLGYWFGKQPG